MPWVREAAGGIAGTGFLVTDRHVLTVAHIVAVALGALGEDAEPPVGSWQLVSFKVRDDEGLASYPFSREAAGFLTYSATHPRRRALAVG